MKVLFCFVGYSIEDKQDNGHKGPIRFPWRGYICGQKALFQNLSCPLMVLHIFSEKKTIFKKCRWPKLNNKVGLSPQIACCWGRGHVWKPSEACLPNCTLGDRGTRPHKEEIQFVFSYNFELSCFYFDRVFRFLPFTLPGVEQIRHICDTDKYCTYPKK